MPPAPMPQMSLFSNFFTPQFNFFSFNTIFAQPAPLNIFYNNVTPVIPKPQSTFNPFNFSNITQKRKEPLSKRVDITKNKALPELKEAGYNKRKGRKLAKEIAKVSSHNGFDNYCARHVKEAIASAGLGEVKPGHAYNLAGILDDNKNFKEISTDGLDLKSLPAGCVLVYDKGVSGYSSQYGHTEITIGDGTAGSGGITNNIRKGARVFIPV